MWAQRAEIRLLAKLVVFETNRSHTQCAGYWERSFLLPNFADIYSMITNFLEITGGVK